MKLKCWIFLVLGGMVLCCCDHCSANCSKLGWCWCRKMVIWRSSSWRLTHLDDFLFLYCMPSFNKRTVWNKIVFLISTIFTLKCFKLKWNHKLTCDFVQVTVLDFLHFQRFYRGLWICRRKCTRGYPSWKLFRVTLFESVFLLISKPEKILVHFVCLFFCLVLIKVFVKNDQNYLDSKRLRWVSFIIVDVITEQLILIF